MFDATQSICTTTYLSSLRRRYRTFRARTFQPLEVTQMVPGEAQGDLQGQQVKRQREISYREPDSRGFRKPREEDPQFPSQGWKAKMSSVSWFEAPTYPIDARWPGMMLAGCLSSSLLLPCPVGVSSERSEQIPAYMTGRTRSTGFRPQPTLPFVPSTT
jgi:hypothetical protein